MVDIRWSPQAASDLEAIMEYIGKDSPSYAMIFGEQLVTVAESLDRDPERGRIVPEQEDASIREIFFKKYRIMYRISEGIVEIVTIIHGSRDYTRSRHV